MACIPPVTYLGTFFSSRRIWFYARWTFRMIGIPFNGVHLPKRCNKRVLLITIHFIAEIYYAKYDPFLMFQNILRKTNFKILFHILQ